MKTRYIAAKIEGNSISLIDQAGYRAAYAGTAGLGQNEVFISANVNGHYLVATTSKNTVITWDITGSPSVISRR